jgi:hypothetical protein
MSRRKIFPRRQSLPGCSESYLLIPRTPNFPRCFHTDVHAAQTRPYAAAVVTGLPIATTGATPSSDRLLLSHIHDGVGNPGQRKHHVDDAQ